MEALGLSSGAAGLISLGLTVSQGVLDYYHSWKDAEDRVTQMYASIEALTKTFRLLESAIEPKVFSLDNVRQSSELFPLLLHSTPQTLSITQIFVPNMIHYSHVYSEHGPLLK